MNGQRIEKLATELQREIWQKRYEIWPNTDISPVKVLVPEVACQLLGVRYDEYEDLGGRFAKFKIAGLIDRQSKVIAISNTFSDEVMRFTAAHEIGHWLLHPGDVMHRDRPINVHNTGRSQKEKEADYFAACFLMPRKLLADEFSKRFGKIPFHFGDFAAYQLSPDDPDALLRSDMDSMDRALSLATTTIYNRQYFHALAKYFRVSSIAMAIRLEELGFIRWP